MAHSCSSKVRVGMRALAACFAAVLAFDLSAATLTFVGTTKDGDQIKMGTAANWDLGRVPEEDDELLFNTWYGGYLYANCGSYVKSMTFNHWFFCWGVSCSGFYVKSGGSGIYFDGRTDQSGFQTCNMWAHLNFSGEVIFNNPILNLWVDGAINGVSDANPGRILKRGAARIAVKTAGNYWTGARIQEGTFKLSSMDGKTGIDIMFDGSNATGYFELGGDLDFVNGALRSSADLPVTNHGITDDGTGYSFTLSGNLQDDAAVFAGGLHGAASFVFNPTDSAKSFEFIRATSTSTGAITVNNGTVKISNGASFASLAGINVSGNAAKLVIDRTASPNLSSATLTLANGGKLELNDGFVRVKAATINGTPVANGIYGSEARDFCTKAAWIGGSGYVVVGISDGDEVAATWNGTGSVAAPANWVGDMPALNDGSALVTVAGGSQLAVDTTDAWLKGFALGDTAFEVAASAGKQLWLGSKGITSPNGANVTLSGDVVLTSPQTWDLGGGIQCVNGCVMSYGGCDLTLTNTSDLVWSNGTTVYPGLTLRGSSALKCGANESLCFKGPITAPNAGSYLTYEPGKGATITCEGDVTAKNCFLTKGVGTVVMKGRLWVNDRWYLNADDPTIELHAKGNRVNGNLGTQIRGTVKTMVEGALSAEDGAMFCPKSAFVLDLCGNDQSVRQLGMHATGEGLGGTVTSEKAAVMHLLPVSYWENYNYNQGFDKQSPRLYGYETADKGVWAGGVTLRYESSNGIHRFMMRQSSSTGCVEVVSGTLVFLRHARTAGETFDLKGGASNPYERFANIDGAWPNASKVIVRGGVLKLEHGKAFGKKVAIELDKAGKLHLDENVRQGCATLTLDGVVQDIGTYGSSESAAQYKDDEHFTGPGVLRVGRLGTMVVLR